MKKLLTLVAICLTFIAFDVHSATLDERISKVEAKYEQRIKKIDRDYYVVYDTSKQKFEIHNSNQVGGSYCLTLPYKELDERTLKYVRLTQTANIEEILKNLENDNNKRESAIKTSAFSNIVDNINGDLL